MAMCSRLGQAMWLEANESVVTIGWFSTNPSVLMTPDLLPTDRTVVMNKYSM